MPSPREDSTLMSPLCDCIIEKEIESYDKTLQNKIFKTQRELEGTFRGFSLHCGGIIYFPNGIPETNILDRNRASIINQVKLNKVNYHHHHHHFYRM